MDEQGVFERVIRADEKAQEAHRRLDRHELAIGELTGVVQTLVVTVAKINVKVAVAAGIGSVAGGGVVAAIVAWYLK